MSFADSWYRASCALLLLTLHFSMFSFYLPLSFSLSLSLAFSFSLLLSLSLSLSLYLCPLFLSVVARHMSSDALYQIFSSWSILLFHTISFHSSYKIHQLFTDYLLRLPSSELLEKHLFRSRANRRLVVGETPFNSNDFSIAHPAHGKRKTSVLSRWSHQTLQGCRVPDLESGTWAYYSGENSWRCEGILSADKKPIKHGNSPAEIAEIASWGATVSWLSYAKFGL